MENFTLHLLVQELRALFEGKILRQASSVATTTFWVFEDIPGALKISLRPDRPLLYRIPGIPASAVRAGFFEQLFGQELRGLTKPLSERVIHFQFESQEVVAELIPHAPQLLLLDAGRVQSVWLKSSRRQLPALSPYQAPPQPGKTDLAEVLRESIKGAPEGQNFARWVCDHWAGFGPLWAEELQRRLHEIGKGSGRQVVRELLDELEQVPSGGYICSERRLDENDFSNRSADSKPFCWPFPQPAKCCRPTATLNEAVERVERYLQALAHFDQARRDLERRLRDRINRAIRLQSELRRILESLGRADEYRMTGDLLLAHLGRLKSDKVPAEITLPDYFDPDMKERTVVLDPNRTWQENAQSYYRRSQKAISGQQAVSRRLAQLEHQLAHLEEFESQLRHVRRVADIDRIAKQLRGRKERGSLRVVISEKKQQVRVKLRRLISSDGFEVLVGRSNRENDQLTFRVARPNDLWFHAADYPGSHVVVRSRGKALVPATTVRQAAAWAAYYSKARDENKTAVHYTYRKFVQKPRGAAPGKVVVTRFKTVVVRPAKPERNDE